MGIWTGRFWKATGERVIATALQAAVPSITVASLDAIDWGAAASITGAAALLSLVKAVIAGLASGTPSVGNAEQLAAATAKIQHDEPPSKLDRMDRPRRHSKAGGTP